MLLPSCYSSTQTCEEKIEKGLATPILKQNQLQIDTHWYTGNVFTCNSVKDDFQSVLHAQEFA